jgi:FtsP/CotA-like multicopper oxidase with cupredoxin domain
MNRRSFLSATGSLVAGRSLRALMPRMFAAEGSPAVKPDYNLRIEPCTLDIGPGVSIKTVAYNGQVPGPLLRLRQGVPVSIDVTNATANSDIVHWHGLAIDSLNDGAMEEGSPMIPAGATHRYSFTPNPAGTRWYHTHASSYGDLSVSTYTGQFGFLLIEGHDQPEKYDQEINLTIHH